MHIRAFMILAMNLAMILAMNLAMILALIAGPVGLVSCTTSRQAVARRDHPAVSDPEPREYPGIHNAVAYHEGFISGGAPVGDAGFRTLREWGVRTVISVDGAVPEVELAEAHGIRYIHIPIGYDGFDEQQKLVLVRATRDAIESGPVYIHCHHGKHRSAGAAAAVSASLGWLTPEQAVERMKVSGTSSAYSGLFACANESTVVEPGVIDAVPAQFPSISTPTTMVQSMVDMDDAIERLFAIEAAGWDVPADHPDLVPAAEAGRLADLYRVLAGSAEVAKEPAEFMALMREGSLVSQAFEDQLAEGERDPSRLSEQLRRVLASCKACHVRFRD